MAKLDEDYYDSPDVELTNQDEKKLQDERSSANNAQNLRNAADVAIATGNPYAAAAGTAVKAADKFTGGKSSELIGKGITAANKVTPGGRIAQGLLNKTNESGLGDKAGTIASYKNQYSGSKETPNQVKNPKVEGGGQKESSLPSSHDKNLPENQPHKPEDVNKTKEDVSKKVKDTAEKEASSRTSETQKKKDEEEYGGTASIKINPVVKVVVIIVLPIALIIFGFIIIFGGAMNNFVELDDAFGISSALGEDTGGIDYKANSTAQSEFYQRIINVKNNNQQLGRNVDALKIVAVYHVLTSHGANLNYDTMTEDKIQDIVDCMYNGSSTSDEIFKNNLISYLIPKYLPKTMDSERVRIADEVFEYIDNYYNLIGKKNESCVGGSCTYTIKGFYIQGKGNVTKNIEVSDLYVRLMQCGRGNGHDYGGTFGLPLEGEELVPFEKYILGVAYQEVGPSAPPEAIKAQMVAARSYILARPTDMGGWRTLKQENGKWILQAAACTQDQVYCDPDKGCSSRNGQWAQVYSGPGHGNTLKGPLAEDSPLRTYANQTKGETLVNDQGYIISTSYVDTVQRQWISMANSGLNYQQILLQYYNQGNHNYHASSISRATCGGGGTCAASGAASLWKQYEGPWINTQMGDSGKTIKNIGCLVTSVAIQISRSGVPTNIQGEFNPGTFVEYLNTHNGFTTGGNFVWAGATDAAPRFVYQDRVFVSGWSRADKLNKIKELVNTPGVYVVAEVKGSTGQHWVAIESVNGDTINMMDPGSTSTNMWTEYNWANTSTLAYFKVS